MASLVNSTKHKEELIPVLLKLLQKSKEGKILPNSFCKASMALIPKPDKDTTRKKLYLISLMNTHAKIFKKV